MIKNFIILFIFSMSLFSKDISVSLDSAIELALKNNILNKISKLNLDIAKAQYQQALSANYPTIDAIMYASRDKNDSIFQQRGVFKLSSELTKTLALANTLQIPGNIPGTTNNNMTAREEKQLEITNTPASFFPESTISADLDSKAKGRDTIIGQVEFQYPLYTGGKISAIIEQSRLNKYIKKQSIIRDENSVVFDVKKYFYGYVLTNELSILINKIYKNLKFSTELAKEFLENGSDLKINRADYLSAKLTTSLIKSALLKINLNKQMLNSAISNLIGLKYNDILNLEYKKQNILKQNISLQKLIEKAYSLNPDMNTLNLALKIKTQQIKEISSKKYPQAGLFGNISHTYNSYKYGYLNQDNENSWSIGIAVNLSLFDGFRTKNQVLEKKIDRKIFEEKRLFLEEAIALQLKNELLRSTNGFEQVSLLKDAIRTASENSRMNFKGFQYEMVEAKDLIQSQLLEVYVKADYLKSVHDYLLSLATIDKLVGKKINESF